MSHVIIRSSSWLQFSWQWISKIPRWGFSFLDSRTAANFFKISFFKGKRVKLCSAAVNVGAICAWNVLEFFDLSQRDCQNPNQGVNVTIRLISTINYHSLKFLQITMQHFVQFKRVGNCTSCFVSLWQWL